MEDDVLVVVFGWGVSRTSTVSNFTPGRLWRDLFLARRVALALAPAADVTG